MKLFFSGPKLILRTLPGSILSLLLLISLAGCGGTAGTQNGSGATNQVTAASWSEQLQAVQTAVAKIDPNAILTDVLSSPARGVSSSWTYSDTFSVTFSFVTSSGSTIGVTYDDTSPAATIKTSELPKVPGSPDQQPVPGDIQQALDQINISPREAGRITADDKLTQTILRGLRVTPIIGIDLSSNPVAWVVQYVPIVLTTGDVDDAGVIRVDAHTGAIIERQDGASAP